MLKAINLLCNDTREPIGVDEFSPTFSWQTETDGSTTRQSAYRITVVKEDTSEIVWDSDKVDSGVSVSISYLGAPLTARTAYAFRVKLWDEDGNEGEWSVPSRFETALMGKFLGQWIGPVTSIKNWKIPDPQPAPMYRKSFTLQKGVKKARAYVCGLGYHVFFVNGKRVSDRVLAPVVSQYDQRVYYDTFDITDYLCEGENVFGVILGNGWYNSYTKDPWNFSTAPWRDRTKLWLESHVEFEDGSSLAVVTDTTWKLSTGPIIADGLRHGEVYDARLERDGWCAPGYDDKDFLPVQPKRSPGGIRTSRQFSPIRCTETLRAQSIIDLGDGTVVLDFGKNISGYIHIRAKGYRDSEITLRYSERIEEDGRINREKISAYIHSGDFQTDKYTMRGDDIEEWMPSFTYHGFRYVEVSGYPGEYTPDAFMADVVYTDLASVGDFECSDDYINRLHAAARLSTLTNFHGMPEDCPHREKNGWTGDAWISAEQLLLNFDARRDYRRWLNDIRDCQRPDGHLPGCIPTADWGYRRTGIIWGAALVLIPWYQYLLSADKRVIEENYEASRLFVENTAAMEVDGTVTHDGETPFAFGDWMPPGGNQARKCSVVLMETATYYMLLCVMAKMARITDRPEDEAFYTEEAKRIKACIKKKFIKDGALTVHSCMTANACMVFHGLDDDGVFLEALVREAENNGGIADFGFHGMKYVLQGLIENGREDVAYKILMNKNYPGWGYMLDCGATTLWETWEGDLSQNHHAFSDIDTFCYKALAGIRIDPSAPGFKHFYLKPFLPDNMSYAKATHESPYGTVESSWRREENEVIFEFTVPTNTEATLTLPDGTKKRLGAGRHVFTIAK